MKGWTIRKQLATIIASICVLAVGLQAAFAELSFRHAFAAYIENIHRPQLQSMAENMAEYYDSEREWNRVQSNPDIWIRVTTEQQGKKGSPSADTSGSTGQTDKLGEPPMASSQTTPLKPPSGRVRGSAFSYTAGPTLALFDVNNEYIFGNAELINEDRKISSEILVGGTVVGYLVSPGGMQIADTVDDAFSDQLRRQYVFAGVFIALLSVLAALPIARQFSRPVTELNEGTDRLMQGDYGTKLDISGPREFGLLEQKFNRLAETLDSHRTSQQNWIANISHELRTPIAVLRAELDALDAGIRKFGEKELNSLIEETHRLNRLVDDLFFLSRSDSDDFNYELASVDLNNLVADLSGEFKERAGELGLSLSTHTDQNATVINGDEGRLKQLFGNLLNNSCAYTDAGGEIQINVVDQQDRVLVEIEDTTPSVPKEDLSKIFDRLYRVEKSRSRAEGGSGLGLSICKVIAKAHGADIFASQSDLGGLKTTVSFPKSAER